MAPWRTPPTADTTLSVRLASFIERTSRSPRASPPRTSPRSFPMAFQTPRSIEEMLTAIHKRDYLMPAIQREFVWGTEQITKLVDSLMRGYPVGSFLLWQVAPTT